MGCGSPMSWLAWAFHVFHQHAVVLLSFFFALFAFLSEYNIYQVKIAEWNGVIILQLSLSFIGCAIWALVVFRGHDVIENVIDHAQLIENAKVTNSTKKKHKAKQSPPPPAPSYMHDVSLNDDTTDVDVARHAASDLMNRVGSRHYLVFKAIEFVYDASIFAFYVVSLLFSINSMVQIVRIHDYISGNSGYADRINGDFPTDMSADYTQGRKFAFLELQQIAWIATASAYVLTWATWRATRMLPTMGSMK